MKKFMIVGLVVFIFLGVYIIAGSATVPQQPSSVSHSAESLIVGVPYEDGGSNTDSGVINLIYGVENTGLITSTSEWFSQDDGLGNVESNDQYGRAVASGDFNGDGYFDIAIGVPYESKETSQQTWVHSGGVNVLYGSKDGFTRQDYFFATNIADITVITVNDYDHFGWSLASGDFDNDGYADLAIGAPNSDCCGTNAGLVCVLYGSSVGLLRDATATFNSLSGQNTVDGHFGWALAAADFDNDGYDDLAIGGPGEAFPTEKKGGIVGIRYGTDRDGIIVTGTTLSQSSIQSGESEDGDEFGWALVTGDFDGNGYADLAVGVPGEDVDSIEDAGAVNVIYNLTNGVGRATLWTQRDIHQMNTTAVLNPSEANDQFGYSLAAGDFDNNGYDDLAIGVPFEDAGSAVDVGLTQILFGLDGNGLSDTKNYHRYTTGSYGGGQESGFSLAAGDFDADGCDDLAIGVPDFSSSSALAEDGGVHIMYGDSSTNYGFRSWLDDVVISQADLPAASPENGDRFGWTLAVLPPAWHHIYLPLILRH